MRKLVYYVGVSLDGYIAGPAGEFDFFPVAEDVTAWIATDYPETIPAHLRPHLGMAVDTPNTRWDTLIMGRGTYEPGLAIGVASPYPHLKQYVVSTTLPEVEDPAVEIVRENPVALVRRLKAEEGRDIWLCGGGTLAGVLADEIDELILKTYPVLAGTGVPVLAGAFHPTRFTPTARREFASGAQVSWYTRA
ncbi:dihydrofolate reductase family protein [Nocardia sp. NPDC003482]